MSRLGKQQSIIILRTTGSFSSHRGCLQEIERIGIQRQPVLENCIPPLEQMERIRDPRAPRG